MASLRRTGLVPLTTSATSSRERGDCPWLRRHEMILDEGLAADERPFVRVATCDDPASVFDRNRATAKLFKER